MKGRSRAFDFAVTTIGSLSSRNFDPPLADTWLRLGLLGAGEPVPGAAVGLMTLLDLLLAGVRRRCRAGRSPNGGSDAEGHVGTSG